MEHQRPELQPVEGEVLTRGSSTGSPTEIDDEGRFFSEAPLPETTGGPAVVSGGTMNDSFFWLLRRAAAQGGCLRWHRVLFFVCRDGEEDDDVGHRTATAHWIIRLPADRPKFRPAHRHVEEKNAAALLQIQLNRYKCGGLVVGICFHHHAADGHSMSMFLTAWATAVREGKAFTTPTPFLHRATTVVPRSTPTPVFDHRSLEFTCGEGGAYAVVPMGRIKNITVHFTAEFVAGLKARVGARCTTFQCLLAHVWKKITAARGLKPEEFTRLRVAVNCRGRADPPVPMNFFGNMVLWAFPGLQVRDVLNLSYGGVVDTIRNAVARIDGEYVQSFVDFGGVADANGEELIATAAPAGSMLCPDAEVDSWLGFGFHKLDFGTGPPAAFLPPDLPVEGLMFFVPSHKANGGIDLFIAFAEHVVAFEQICYLI